MNKYVEVHGNSEYQQYEELLADVLENGRFKSDRTGTGTYSVFGRQMRFDLSKGFPLVTTKKLHTRSIFIELLWFLRGETNNKWLTDRGVTIWDEWSGDDGELGRIYGAQWRSWAGPNGETIDQITNVFNSLKNNPDSRRHIVSAWNPAEIDQMALPPCHALFQFYVDDLTLNERVKWWADTNGCDKSMLRSIPVVPQHEALDDLGVPRKRLSCQLFQRSSDEFLGKPYNIASYALLTHMFAHQLNYAVGDFVWTGGDVHLYQNHVDQAKLQLSRSPYPYPTLKINRKPDSIFDYNYEDFEIVNYQSHPHIKAPVAV